MSSVSSQFGAFNALVNLRRGQAGEGQSLGRLSSGERIQRAHEDSVNLSISNNLRAEIKAYRQVRANNFEGVNTIQIADGALDEVVNVMTRIAELAEQAANEATGGPDGSPTRQTFDTEYQELLTQIDYINDNTRFNDITLFGSAGSSFVVNLNPDVVGSADQLTVTTSSFSTLMLGMAGTAIDTVAGATAVVDLALEAISQLGRQRGRLGALEERLAGNLDHISQQIVARQDAETQVRETDIAEETVNLTRYQILNQSNLAVMSQANLSQDRVLQLLQ